MSDLLNLEGIRNNATAIIVSDAGRFKVVAQPGDDGDMLITGDRAFIVTAIRASSAEIIGNGWNNAFANRALAPHIPLEIDEATPVLAIDGLVVNEVFSLTASPFRVKVQNLSTGASVSTMTDDSRYNATFVEATSNRAAQIGDVLQITVETPNPFIGVQPLRHTVSSEDVNRSRIQFPNLVAYQIPTKTELLPNYPNPFNPETWIPYRLAEDAFVTLTIYDMTGEIVRNLEVGHKPAAVYESKGKAVYWNGRNNFGEQVASGVYFYTMQAEDFAATRKFVILK